MEVFFTRIADVFQISGRGSVVAYWLDECAPEVNLKVGDTCRIKTTDGKAIQTQVKGFEMINYRHPPKRLSGGILVDPGISAEFAAAGAELWKVTPEGS